MSELVMRPRTFESPPTWFHRITSIICPHPETTSITDYPPSLHHLTFIHVLVSVSLDKRFSILRSAGTNGFDVSDEEHAFYTPMTSVDVSKTS